MTTSKPLQTSTDSIPDNSVTLNKLGTGSIPHIYTAQVVNSDTDSYQSLDGYTTGNTTPQMADMPQIRSGNIRKCIVYVTSNNRTTDFVLTFIKNDVPTTTKIIIPNASIVGDIINVDLDLDFDISDVLCMLNTGELGKQMTVFYQLEIDYDN